MTDLHTDGNHLAGVLTEFLSAEVTTAQRRCQSCHAEHPLAAHRAYHGAGAVLRCPGCGDVAVRIAEHDADIVVEWRGTYRARRPAGAIEVLDRGRPVSFSLEDLMRYHGPGSPGGVAHAFKVLERALPLLGGDAPPERRELTVETAFGGPGARDAFELVTRAVTEGRYVVDAALGRPERGRTLERFVFRVTYRDRAVTLLLREGYVTDEFIELARKQARTAEETARLDVLKRELADRVTARPATEVYDASP